MTKCALAGLEPTGTTAESGTEDTRDECPEFDDGGSRTDCYISRRKGGSGEPA